jgi:hypothetical protein
VLSIRRERFVGDGMQDLFAVQNQGMEPIEFDLELEVGTDFATSSRSRTTTSRSVTRYVQSRCLR